jgi:4-diphosphocytidyl-2-C-methyl-D-erythritol kinase
VRRAPATAKLNLTLVVGPKRDDGRHEVATVLQRLDLADRIAVEPSERLRVEGFPDDTLVRAALETLASAAAVEPRWLARIWKRIPVAAGLGGGSSDAATALRLANALRRKPLPEEDLRAHACELGADVPYFLADGYGKRRAELAEALANVRRPRDLAALPPNDLASSPVAEELRDLGAFRADVTGAGPAVYGLFHHREQAAAAERRLRLRGRTWLSVPTWYG